MVGQTSSTAFIYVAAVFDIISGCGLGIDVRRRNQTKKN